jgi:hypothetical protein
MLDKPLPVPDYLDFDVAADVPTKTSCPTSSIVQFHTCATLRRRIARKAKKIFKRIEDCALFTEDVRKTCETVKRRIETSGSGLR